MFFYGTLRHVPLLRLVLGPRSDPLDITEATLPGFAVFDVIGHAFPILVEVPDAVATGLLVRGLSEQDVARLEYYEGGFNFGLHQVTVRVAENCQKSALVFLPQPGTWDQGALWSLEDWTNNWSRINLRAAHEVMAHYGHISPAEIAARFPGIRIRAAAWVAARGRPADPDHDLDRDVVVHAHHRPYSNFFAAEEMDLQYRRYDGSLSPVLNRGAQVLGSAVVVLPYDPVKDAVLLVEQFRAPLFIGGARAPWLQEPVSGMIDPGETPQEAGCREAMEEAGLSISHLESVSGVYSSSGATSEFVHLFVGLTDLNDRQEGGGMAQEGEDIRAEITSYTDLMDGIDEGRYRDMPLLACALWLARHRARLRRIA